MKNSLAPVYGDVLAFRWLALSGLYVLLCRLKRDADMSLVKLGNSKDSLFECRALVSCTRVLSHWSASAAACPFTHPRTALLQFPAPPILHGNSMTARMPAADRCRDCQRPAERRYTVCAPRLHPVAWHSSAEDPPSGGHGDRCRSERHESAPAGDESAQRSRRAGMICARSTSWCRQAIGAARREFHGTQSRDCVRSFRRNNNEHRLI